LTLTCLPGNGLRLPTLGLDVVVPEFATVFGPLEFGVRVPGLVAVFGVKVFGGGPLLEPVDGCPVWFRITFWGGVELWEVELCDVDPRDLEPRDVAAWDEFEPRDVEACELRDDVARDDDVTAGFATTAFFCCAASACRGMHAAAINKNKAAPRSAAISIDPVNNSTSIARSVRQAELAPR
jgi:hypothetical protein